MEEISSMFRPVSLGKVLEDKELGTDVIQVALIEAATSADGAAISDSRTLEAKGVDAQGKEYTVKTNTDTVVTAKWLKWGSQRITAPDIRRLERVQIYQFADQDEYYWTDLGLDTHLRRLETVVYGINNNPDATELVKPDPTNMHTFELSSHTKQITLRTCKTQGEPTAFVFQFNLGGGAVVLADDLGNEMTLDSVEAIWAFRNSFGSFLNIDKNNIMAYAAELISMETRDFYVKADSVLVECNRFTANVKNNTHFETPIAEFSNHVSVGYITTGYNNNNTGMHSVGNMRVDGNLVLNGDANIAGKITCAGIDSSQRINAPNID